MTSVLIRREIWAETHRKEVFCAMQGKGDHLQGKKRSLLEKKKNCQHLRLPAFRLHPVR